MKWHPEIKPSVNELRISFEIDGNTKIGENAWLDGGPPHYFKVTLDLDNLNPDEIREHYEVLTEIIDMEKPAHTYYELELTTFAMKIGESEIGKDTLLGIEKKIIPDSREGGKS